MCVCAGGEETEEAAMWTPAEFSFWPWFTVSKLQEERSEEEKLQVKNLHFSAFEIFLFQLEGSNPVHKYTHKHIA